MSLGAAKDWACISILLFIALFYDAVTAANYATSFQELPFDYEPTPTGKRHLYVCLLVVLDVNCP